MHVLVTGATGYAGRGLAEELAANYAVRGLDVRPGEIRGVDIMTGDLADLDVCRKAVEGMDAVVMCHMAPNPTGYETPVQAVDVNVKGTANLYHALAEAGVAKVVLISSGGVLKKEKGRDARPGEGPYNFNNGLYILTKIMQEQIARFYYETKGIRTAILRPGWVVYDDLCVTKYGQKLESYSSTLMDPRDIGRAAALAMSLPDLELESFNMEQEGGTDYDTRSARERLGFVPRHTFASLNKS
jgi:nucleoside-diphosphate-sugar epimerase